MKLFRPLLGSALLGALLAAIALVVGIVPIGARPSTARHSVPAAASNPGPIGTSTTRPATTTTTSAPEPPRANDPAFAQQAEQTVRKSVPDARVGVEVFDRNTGTVLTSLNEDQQFPMMSVVKLLIAMEVLNSNNWALPGPDTQQDLTRMLAYSDDGIANDLWGSYGGPAIITAMSGVIGLQNTDPPTADSGEWGDTLTTPADIVTLYQYIAEILPAPDHDLIVDALNNAPETAADGSDQYFGIPNGMPNTPWAIKQGWGSSGVGFVVNTTGLVGGDDRYVVVVLTSSEDGSDSTLRSAITAGTTQLTPLVS